MSAFSSRGPPSGGHGRKDGISRPFRTASSSTTAMTSQGGYYQKGIVDPIEAAALRRENRKRLRREDRQAQRKKRIEAQVQWSAERRALREAREKKTRDTKEYLSSTISNRSPNSSCSSSRRRRTPNTPPHLPLPATGTDSRKARKQENQNASSSSSTRVTDGKRNFPSSSSTPKPNKKTHRTSPSDLLIPPTPNDDENDGEKREGEEEEEEVAACRETLLSSSSSFPKKERGTRQRCDDHLHHHSDSVGGRSVAMSMRKTGRGTSTSASPAAVSAVDATMGSPTPNALTFYRRREHVGNAPPSLQRLVHRCVNKLTIRNVVDISKDIADVFRGGVPITRNEGEREGVGRVERKTSETHEKQRWTATTRMREGKNEGEDEEEKGSRHHLSRPSSVAQEEMMPVSRDTVLSCVLDAVHQWAGLDSTGGGSGVPTMTACLPFAGLLRGVQILGGEMVAARIVEYLSLALYAHVQDGEESTANALVMLLSLLYRLYGMDVVLVSSLLQFLLAHAEKEVERIWMASNDTLETAAPLSSSSSSPLLCPPALPSDVLCSASCAVTLLRTCGEKLWKEKATLVDDTLRRTKQLAERLTHDYPSTMTSSSSSRSTHTTTTPIPHAKDATQTNVFPYSRPMIAGSARFVALVRVMRESIHGKHSPKRGSKSGATDEDAERIEHMLQDLKQLLPSYRHFLSKEGSASASVRPPKTRGGGGQTATPQDDEAFLDGDAGRTSSSSSSGLSPHQDRLLTRVLHTTHRVEGIAFDHLLVAEKPPRWWVPGVLADAIHHAHATEDDTKDGEEEETSAEEDDEEKEAEEAEEREREKRSSKLQQIKEMRAQEKAIAGQRFHTENTREIFHCFTSATDDLDAFSMLLRRDPQYQHFPDVCKVALQCCVQEKHVNPFYGSVLERFCHSRRACRVVLQFVLWDYFKSVRLSTVPDMCGFLNIACTIATWMENGVLDLTVLRGLDLEETNKMIGLLARVILLRILLFLSPKQLLTIFFGGNGSVALDFKTDTTSLRASLNTLLERYFDDGHDKITSNPLSRKGKQRSRPLSGHEEEKEKPPLSNAPTASNTKWLVALYDVVAAGTAFDIYAAPSSSASLLPVPLGRTSVPVADGKPLSLEDSLAAFQKRVQIARKALNQGLL